MTRVYSRPYKVGTWMLDDLAAVPSLFSLGLEDGHVVTSRLLRCRVPGQDCLEAWRAGSTVWVLAVQGLGHSDYPAKPRNHTWPPSGAWVGVTFHKLVVGIPACIPACTPRLQVHK